MAITAIITAGMMAGGCDDEYNGGYAEGNDRHNNGQNDHSGDFPATASFT